MTNDFSIIYCNLLSNRESAIFVWFIIVSAFLLLSKTIRKSTLNLLKIFIEKKILLLIIGMLLYVSFEVFLLYLIKLWNISLIKDTILWIGGIAFVLLINSHKDKFSFKKILCDNLKFIIIIGFLVNFYNLNFWIEFVLFPVLFILFWLAIVEKPIKKIANFVLLLFGGFLIVFTIIQLVINFSDFVSYDTLQTFILPLALTLLYMPFIYLMTLYMKYGVLFCMINLYYEDDPIFLNIAKHKIFNLCKFSIKNVDDFTNKIRGKITKLSKKKILMDIIKEFNKSSN